MRYDNWDTILFSKDSHIPIQEFKTACYVVLDEYGRQLPTLTCYITSLPASSPFRISLHSWSAKTRPTALIESQRKSNQRVVYTISVVVDGARVFHDFYEVHSKWPQEIVHEKRTVAQSQHQSSQQKPLLEFPPFRQNVLMQSSWDARDNSGRIKVLLSEQLVGKSSSLNDLEYGTTNHIVCFLFQHAPRDILEQAGIAWPIRNPLYFPSTTDSRPSTSQFPLSYPMVYDQVAESRPQSPVSMHFKAPFARPHNPEPHRPNTAPLSHGSHCADRSFRDRRRGRGGIWDDSTADEFADNFDDDISMMESWSNRQSSSRLAGDHPMADVMVVSPPPSKQRDSRRTHDKGYDLGKRRSWNDSVRNRVEEDRHVVVTFKEDQLGRLVEAFSPPKPPRNADYNPRRYDQSHNSSAHTTSHGNPPKVANMGIPGGTRPSAAALARTSSYSNFNPHLRDISNKDSPTHHEESKTNKESNISPPLTHTSTGRGKENRNPSTEQRVPTPFPFDSRHPPFNNFLQGPEWGPSSTPKPAHWDPDVDMRDQSSQFSSLSRLEKISQQQQSTTTGKNSPIPNPCLRGGLKSRKEGMGLGSPASASEFGARHDKSLLPALDGVKQSQTVQDSTVAPDATVAVSNASPQLTTETTSQIDTDARKPFVPGHRGGMNSMERVESELFSALGEEFSSFSQGDTMAATVTTTTDNETLDCLAGLDSPVMKRKRGDSLGGDRGRSPDMKVLRDEREGGVRMGQMRGGAE